MIQLHLIGSQRKIILFGLMGAVGCFLAAILGELFLYATYIPPPKPVPQAVCLLLDCSGSMGGGKLPEMKSAALQLIQRQDLTTDQISIVGFGSLVHYAAPLTGRKELLQSAVTGLDDGGGTDMAAGLGAVLQTLQSTSGRRSVLLFTDGIPDSKEDTLLVADQCRAAGIRIVVVMTGDADSKYLSQVTADPSLVFSAASGNFSSAFQQAEKVIYGRQLTASDQTASGTSYGVARVAGWTALLAIGVALALIGGQNRYLRRTTVVKREVLSGILGGLGAGLIAGTAAQLLFSITADANYTVVLFVQFIAWALLGALVGLGVSFFVPNLKPSRGLLGGIVGGAVGGLGFIVGALVLTDAVGRLAGAGMLGFCIGAMIALVEAVFREAWLEVRYNQHESRTVSLGKTPIAIGSNQELCKVFARTAPPIALRYSLVDGRISCEDVPAGQSFDVTPGDVRTAGNLSIVVCGQSAPPQKTVLQPSPMAATNAAAATAGAEKSTNDVLHLSIRSARHPLHNGAKLRAAEIGGLETKSADGAVAEVVPNPANPSVLGLKNLSTATWSMTVDGEAPKQVEPGRSVRLKEGTRIRFGAVEGKIE